MIKILESLGSRGLRKLQLKPLRQQVQGIVPGSPSELVLQDILKGSWDLVIGVISKVSTVIMSYNPN